MQDKRFRPAGLVFFTLMLVGFMLGAAAQHSAVTPVPRENDWWQKRHAAMNARVAEGNAGLILIGDSITQGWEGSGKEVWAEYYAHRNAVNLGISGDRTEHVLWRLENGNIDGIAPKAAVVMIGTNNWKDNSPEEITEGVTAIVEKLRSSLPGTKVLLLAIFPRADVPEEYRDNLLKVNGNIAALADWDNIYFLDLASVLLDENGVLPETVMPDLLHPNATGYQIWAAAMEPMLSCLLGDEPVNDPGTPWRPLFNGENLTGWEPVDGGPESWGAEDGLLFTTGEGGGWLSTADTFGDFDLTLEFRVPPNGNSGVFIRAPRKGNPAFEGSEIQVLDDYGDQYTELQPWQFTGSVYATIAPSARVTRKAGEWQHLRIRAQGANVQVWVNGVRVVNGNLGDHMDKLDEHPGLARESGHIGLQNHGSRLDYRNIKIRGL